MDTNTANEFWGTDLSNSNDLPDITFVVSASESDKIIMDGKTRYFKLDIPHSGWRGWINWLTFNWCYKPQQKHFNGKFTKVTKADGYCTVEMEIDKQ